uniref:MAGE domain-containing protein n=1 Tax=Mustela putorius furo TaxID=9669 RepID=M3XLY4_MUSPF
LTMKVGLLEQFLLYKYKMKQPIVKEDMMNVIGQNYKNQYPEILKRASERIEVVFAVELKEVDSTRHSYDLVSKVKLPNNGRVRAGRGLPKTGLLMTVLGVIFMKGNCAAEEDIWKFLEMRGKKKSLNGKLIIQKEMSTWEKQESKIFCCPRGLRPLISCLLSVTLVSSCLGDRRASEKRGRARAEAQGEGAQATVAVEEESTSSSPPQSEDITQSLPPAVSSSTFQGRRRAQAITITSTANMCTRSDEDSNSQDEDRASPFEVPYYTESAGEDSLIRKPGLLEQFLLYKYKMKQPILKEDMLKIIGQNYEDQFPEILKKASERIEIVFAVDLKEIDSTKQSYDLISKLKLPNNGRVRAGRGLPKTGLLMNILGMIFMKGNCAAEEDIWKFLGPKAQAETSKMKVLEFLAKVNDTIPSAFPSYYEEALKDEEKKVQTRAMVTAGTIAKVLVPSRPMPQNIFPP